MIVIVQVEFGRGHGAERMLEYMLDSLPEDLRNQIAILQPPDCPMTDRTRAAGVMSIPLKAKSQSIRHTIGAAWAAGRELRERLPVDQQPTIVHGWTARAFEPALVIAKQLGCPCTGTLHDHPRAAFFSPVRHWLLKQSGRRLRPLICVSHATADACATAWGTSRPPVVIQNGIPGSPCARNEDCKIAGREDRGGPLRVGFVGMHSELKGFSLVRDTMARIGPDAAVAWELYGDPIPSHVAMLDALPVEARRAYTLHGWQPAEEVFAQCDVVFHASTAFDPFPTVLLEAARAGLPVIATDLGGSQEIVENGETGFLIPPDATAAADRLQRLLSDPNLGKKLGRAARDRYLKRFTIDRMIADYTRIWTANPTTGDPHTRPDPTA